MSLTKQGKIDEFLSKPLEVGDYIIVMGLGSQNKRSWGNSAKVISIKDGVPYIDEYDRGQVREVTEEWIKSTRHIGNNPFPEERNRVQNINFQLDSILHCLFKAGDYNLDSVPIMEANFNPFVIIDGVKKYYQRPLVWELKDKQLLVESIYNEVDCGKILVRNRGWKELKELKDLGHELSFRDVVDGKQRICAVKEFIDNGFPDLHGNYYDDLSDLAQYRFTNHQLFSYSELSEKTSDEEVLNQFLRLNFSGVPQSQEHLDYVKSLIKI